MKQLLSKFIKSNFHVGTFVAIGWATVLLLHSGLPLLTAPRGFLFLIFAVMFSQFLLRSFGYFDWFRLTPRKSDAVLMVAAFCTGGFVARTTVEVLSALLKGSDSVALFGSNNYYLTNTFLWCGSLSAGVAVFASHYLFNFFLVKLGRKKKIVLELLPEERESLVQDFESLGEPVEFLTKNDLREHFLRKQESEIDLIVISRGAVSQFEVDAMLVRAHLAGIKIEDYSKVSSLIPGRIRLHEADEWSYLLGALPQTTVLRGYDLLKRIVEPLAAAVLAFIFSPLYIVLSLLIKMSSPGPVFYRQVRTGHLGKNFTLIKFRSMRNDAEKDGIQWAQQNDSRVTPLGKFMRATRLDELPQLWNVMKGEMSFVGPRPERPEIYRDLKKEIPLFSMRTVVRPGITGWAQVCAGYAASIEESHTKLEFDLFYIQNISPRLDLIILLKTIEVALFGDKAARRVEEATAQRAVR